MRTLYSILGVCAVYACASSGALAQTPAEPETGDATEAASEPRELFLWSATRGGETSHLLGTCHVGVSLQDALPGDTRLVLQNAERVILEADVASGTAGMPGLLLPDGETLQALLSESAWDELERRVSGRMPIDAVNRLRPWVASTLVGINLEPTQAGAAPVPPMDLALLQAARLAGTEALFLETMADQALIMNEMPQGPFVEALEEDLIGGQDGAADSLAEMLRAYRAGDADQILALLSEEDLTAGLPEFRQRLLIDRNEAWLSRLDDWLGQGGTLVAVGLAHLLGEDGLLQSLRQAGFTIDRIARPTLDAAPVAAPDSNLPAAHVPEVTVTISPEGDIFTGDLLTVQIVATATSDDEVTVPEQDLAPFEVFDRRVTQVELANGRTEYTYEIDLLALQPGTHNLGPLRLRVMTAEGLLGNVHTDTHSVVVTSLLANEPNAEPKPASSPVVVRERDETLLWLAGILGLVLLTILFTVLVTRWWNRRPRALPPPPPPRPPWEVAHERLTQLDQQMESSFENGHAVEWMDELNDVLREFLGSRFGFEGLESTTDEILAKLRRSTAPTGVASEAAVVLGECDLVQFARAPASLPTAADLLSRSRRLVEFARADFRSEIPRPPSPPVGDTEGAA